MPVKPACPVTSRQQRSDDAGAAHGSRRKRRAGTAGGSARASVGPVDRRGAETNKAGRGKRKRPPARPCPGRFRYYPERARASRVLAARSGTTSPALGRDASPSRTTGKASLLANSTVRLVDAAAAASSSEQRAASSSRAAASVQQQAAATRPAATSRTAAARQKQPEAAQNPPAEHS